MHSYSPPPPKFEELYGKHCNRGGKPGNSLVPTAVSLLNLGLCGMGSMLVNSERMSMRILEIFLSLLEGHLLCICYSAFGVEVELLLLSCYY